MKVTTVNIITKPDDQYTQKMHYMIFHSLEDRKSYRGMVRESFRNYPLWKDILQKGKGTLIDVEILKGTRIVNCDIAPKLLNQEGK